MEKKSEKNQAAETNQVVDSRIAAVRDLIFGENIQQYNSEFEDVFNRIKALEDETQKNLGDSVSNLENKLADLESLMDHKFQDLNDDLDKRLADLDDEKADRKKLGKALEKIALMLQE
ncbi:hypothetical protein CW731_00915 [Polaribacter sp. ALD11]|uniref:hypothetical protein n=1 Tax=Polaribacter sp. ALD11 TaxID=2058137 RepID=UPI000C318B27|nr:hypothetical protein [Polaribacter sp. ALD11]AUC83935.1 hypothetical protein CW731_00915 [Polaribacter sp. ALD11]